jgi:hypothetical protein
MQAWSATQHDGTGEDHRERPTIRAHSYMILRSPLEFGKKDSSNALAAARKLHRHRRIWELAHETMSVVDATFAARYIVQRHSFCFCCFCPLLLI